MLKSISRPAWYLFSNKSRILCLGGVKVKKPTLLPHILNPIPLRTMATAGATPTGEPPKFTNRLAEEKSPYLLQHAHNPVDWYPWGEEAIQKAKIENKLIFLSVGYSTCHWCHVMEHESFESEEVAKIMNENFVNVKVDREERPDIDKIYMHFVLMSNGSGGWPMSVWLTPDLAPITAGTYFPPTDRWGMPGFKTVLLSIAKKWNKDQRALTETGQKIIHAIQKSLTEKTSDTFERGSADAIIAEALKIFKRNFDEEYGGFGSNPKFPEVSRLNFLFHAYTVTKDLDVLGIVLKTLEKIGNGGIHDHLFGGFARYAVDRQWHVPHFEKMLYDQGQLLSCYTNAYKLTRDEKYLDIADGIYRYIMKDLRNPLGGFYSGEDADSLPALGDKVKIEGAFYAWTWLEIHDEIAENGELFEMDSDRVMDIYSHHYDIQEDGNVEPASDPHGHLLGKNIHIVRKSIEETSKKFNIPKEELEDLLRTVNEVLHKVRDLRPRPHLDTKIITSWNGLVLSGLAKLACCDSPKQEEYLQAAKDLVKFLKNYSFNAEGRTLLRTCYGQSTSSEVTEVLSDPIEGYLDDYAFLIKGLLDYYIASLDTEALTWARELQDIQDTLFWDETHGAYFYSQENAPNVVIRLKEDHDGAEPCGNSVAISNLILLSNYFDVPKYKNQVEKTLDYFGDSHPFAYVLPELTSGLILKEHGIDLVAVVGPHSEDTNKFVETCRQFYIPGIIIARLEAEQASSVSGQEKFKMIQGKPTAYICHNKVCQMPITDIDELEKSLKTNFLVADGIE